MSNMESNGWLNDVWNCVNEIPGTEFDLNDMYKFVGTLQDKHPDNHNIKAKIRQQLQVLRDKDVIEFQGNGQYKKK